MKHYNYIFTGSGLSALMTVYEMVLSRKFEDKTILLIDENSKKTGDAKCNIDFTFIITIQSVKSTGTPLDLIVMLFTPNQVSPLVCIEKS